MIILCPLDLNQLQNSFVIGQNFIFFQIGYELIFISNFNTNLIKYIMDLTFSIFIIVMGIVQGQYINSPCFTTQLVTLWDHNDASHVYIAGGQNFARAWISSLPNLTSITLSLVTFKIDPVNAQMSFDTTMSFTNTQGIINVQLTSGFQITFIQYSVLLVSSCSGNIENVIKNYYCTYMNLPGKTGNYQYFNVTSVKFPTFSVPTDYSICIFLQSFIGSTTAVQDIGYKNFAVHPTCLQIQIFSQIASHHLITKITFVIFIIQLSSFNDNLVQFHNFIQLLSPLPVILTFSFSAPAIFNPGFHSDRCFYGLTWILNQSPSSNPTQFYSFTPAGVQNTIWNTNIAAIDYQIYCFAQCQNNSYVVNPAVSTINCVLCSSVITNCILCFNSTHCNVCRQFYYNLTNGSCQINCTSIQHCNTCSLLSTVLNCLTCQIGYTSNSTNCNSICGDGFVTPEQQCDDGNLLGNDGCSIGCAIELRFYCIINSTMSICYPCSSICLLCQNSDFCNQCQTTAYLLNRTTSIVCYNNSCPVNYFNKSISPSIRHCVPCPFDCLTCLNQTVCIKCQLGLVVLGGCSQISGCTEVVQDYILMKSPCINCEATLILNLSLCDCPIGFWMITRFCTNIVGCVSTSINGSTVICLCCDKSKILTLINGSCICKPGMTLNSSGICLEICGDGILYQMKCDDGNSMSGDGCSSNCQIEPKYSCVNGSATNRSVCIYLGKNFKITFDSVNKIQNENRALIILNIFPKLHNFDNLSIITNITFLCNKTASLIGWSYKQGQLQLEVNYGQAIEGVKVSLNINFNHDLIKQTSIDINFNLVSKGAKLLYMSSYSSSKIIEYLFLGFDCLVLLVFLLGSATHKMIGVESIHSFQLIFFLHSINNNYTFFFLMFKYLTYLNGNFMYFFNKQLNIPNPSGAFDFSLNNQQMSTISIFSLILLVFAVSLIFKIISLTKKQQKTKIKYQRLSICVYNNAVFPIVVGFYYVNSLTFNIMVGNQKISLLQNLNPYLGSMIYCILVGLTAVVIFFQCKGIFIRQTHKQSYYGLKDCNQNHIPFYLVYILLTNLSLVLNYLGYFSYSQLFIVGLTILYFLLYCQRRRYKKQIHNASLIYNFAMVIIFGVWSILRNIVAVLTEADFEFIGLMVLMLIMLISIFITIGRIISEIRQKFQIKQLKLNYLQNKAEENDNDQILAKQSLRMMSEPLNFFNQYSLAVIIQKQKIDDYNEQNRERLLNNQEMIYSQNDFDKTVDRLSRVLQHKHQKQASQERGLKEVKQKLKQSFKKMMIGIEKRSKQIHDNM